MSYPVPNSALDIRNKIRKLVGSPSGLQIDDATINGYINTFYLYDMPEHLQTFTLKTSYVFYTQPNVDSYTFPREQFRTLSPPLYIAGYESFYSQDRDQFYRLYPQLEYIEQVSTGTGAFGPYTLQLTQFPMLRGYTWPTNNQLVSQVLINSTDSGGNGIIARDNGNGQFVDQNGNLLAGFIDYVTGQATVTFAVPPAPGAVINAQYIPVQPARPLALLFYGDLLFLRPMPDQVYKVQLNAYVFPTQFIADSNTPQLNEWWQYIAYGAALKILTDRLDIDGVQRVRPFFEEQQRLVLRRTIVQNTTERTATIYTEQTQFPYGYYGRNF